MRLRISPSEMTRLLESGHIEETIHFGPGQDAKLTYVLETVDGGFGGSSALSARCQPAQIAVLIPAGRAHAWANGNEVGLYSEITTGIGKLELAVEKDFACLDRNDAGNSDSFPNPRQGSLC